MSVYVDDPIWPFGRMMMCHMISDTEQELLIMAFKIGVDTKWIQRDKRPYPHFDICKSKRNLAVKNGAIECDREQFVRVMNKLRNQHSMTTIPIGFGLKLNPSRPRLSAEKSAPLIKQISKGNPKYALSWKSEICGPLEEGWIQATFGKDYHCGFAVRGGQVFNLFALVTPSGSEYNGETDEGIVSDYTSESDWAALTKLLIDPLKIDKDLSIDNSGFTPTRIWKKPQSTEPAMAQHYEEDKHCYVCHTKWGRVLSKDSCICTGDVEISMKSPPGTLSDPPPEKEQPRIILVPCWQISILEPAFPNSPKPYDMGFNFGPGITGKEYPWAMRREGTVFTDEEEAKRVAEAANTYLVDISEKKKKDELKQAKKK